MRTQPGETNGLLAGWREGDRASLDELWPLLRGELRRIARRHLARERKDCTIHPSSLVQLTLLRVLPAAGAGWRNRAHFLAVVSCVMRHVLVDHARDRLRQKRGGAAVRIPIEAAALLSPEHLEQIVAVDLALQRLAERDQRKSKVFEMRFFCGLSVNEVAESLGVAPNTVIRDWSFAQAWLRRELGGIGTVDCGTLAAD